MQHGLRAAEERDSGSPITLLLPQAAAAPRAATDLWGDDVQGGKGRTTPLPWGPACICSLLQLCGSPPAVIHPSPHLPASTKLARPRSCRILPRSPRPG